MLSRVRGTDHEGVQLIWHGNDNMGHGHLCLLSRDDFVPREQWVSSTTVDAQYAPCEDFLAEWRHFHKSTPTVTCCTFRPSSQICHDICKDDDYTYFGTQYGSEVRHVDGSLVMVRLRSREMLRRHGRPVPIAHPTFQPLHASTRADSAGAEAPRTWIVLVARRLPRNVTTTARAPRTGRSAEVTTGCPFTRRRRCDQATRAATPTTRRIGLCRTGASMSTPRRWITR